MPEATPIYGFPFPCPDEVITPSVFLNLANAIDSKLTELVADETAALNRPNAHRTSASNTATNGVLKVTTGANSSFVIPESGVWMIWAFVPSIGGAGSANELRLQVRRNAVAVFGDTRNTTGGMTFQNVSTVCSIVCTAGDIIDTDLFYTGTLTIDYTVVLALKMIVRIA